MTKKQHIVKEKEQVICKKVFNNLTTKKKLSVEAKQALYRFGVNTSAVRKKIITPLKLWKEFIEYLKYVSNYKWFDKRNKIHKDIFIPTIVGFCAFTGLSPRYIHELKKGEKNIKEFTTKQLQEETFSFKEINNIQEAFNKGYACMKGENFSDIMEKILIVIENNTIQASLLQSSKYGNVDPSVAKLILKNHFGYKEKYEQDINSQEKIVIINDIDPSFKEENSKKIIEDVTKIKTIENLNKNKENKEIKKVNGSNYDLSFLLGDN